MSVCFDFMTGTSILNNGSDQILRWKSPLKKFRDERVKGNSLPFDKGDKYFLMSDLPRRCILLEGYV